MEPENLPEFVHDLAEWTRVSAPALWSGKAAQGSPFYWPPGVTDPTRDALALRKEVYDRSLRQTGVHAQAHADMIAVQRKATTHSYEALAAYHATTLRQAKLLYVGKDISYLAARTEMREFRLDLDLFYVDPVKKEGLMTCGFIMWESPIGEAEPRGQLTAQYNNKTGELIDVELVDDMMAEFRDAEAPVNALTWRILPGAEEVLIVFYTDGTKARKGYEHYIAAQKAALPPGAIIDQDAIRLMLSDMQPLEREQVLPLGKTLAWFEQDDVPEQERLQATILSDPSFLREAERHHVDRNFLEANRKVLPMLSQMTKTFVATLAIRRMKLTRQEEVEPPRSSVKRMRRAGAEIERQEGKVRVLSIGKPLTRRTSGSSGGGGKWKVKTIIGPVIRTRQYVPALDEYREGTWMIEPYVAGPEDAPWSKNAKVFLVGDAPEKKEASPEPAAPRAAASGSQRSELEDEGSDPRQPVTFTISDSAADFIERALAEHYGKDSSAYFRARCRDREGRSSFTTTLYLILCLAVDVGYLLEDVGAGVVDATGLTDPLKTLTEALDSIRSTADSKTRESG